MATPPAARRQERGEQAPRARSGCCSDAERLATAARVAHVGVVELEAFVQSLAREIELGAFEIREALRIDDDPHAMAFELRVLGLHLVGELELVREPRASGRAHAEAQADALAPLLQVRRNV